MSAVKVTFSAGAGVCLDTPSGTVWVDFMHNLTGLHTSSVDEAMWDKIKKNPELKPDVIAFTHRHPDHFTLSYLKEAMDLFPESMVFVPLPVEGYGEVFPGEDEPVGTVVDGEEAVFCVQTGKGALELKYARTEHSGEPYRNTPNYCLTVKGEGFSIFLSGDTLVGEENAVSSIINEKADIGFFTFPWIMMPEGKDAIKRSSIRHIMLYHIPFEKDDDINCRAAALKAAENSGFDNLRLLLEPFQREVFV
ncbi:MAG: MBL fold metallo-hydrolase [Lachnospiraceae bacterium]|jgi:L-ascorbate metabolism protein UlaG (beta-lactamase superfamily)